MTANQTSLKFTRIDGEKLIRGIKGDIGWKKISFDLFNGRFVGKFDIIIGENDGHTSSWIFKVLDESNDFSFAKVFKGPVIELFCDESELISMVKGYARNCYAKKDEREATMLAEPLIQLAPYDIKMNSEPVPAQN